MTERAIVVSLSSKSDNFIQSQLKKGRYPSSDATIEIALELLAETIYLEEDENKHHYQEWLDATRQKITTATQQLERGEGIDGEVAFAMLREKKGIVRAAQI